MKNKSSSFLHSTSFLFPAPFLAFFSPFFSSLFLFFILFLLFLYYEKGWWQSQTYLNCCLNTTAMTENMCHHPERVLWINDDTVISSLTNPHKPWVAKIERVNMIFYIYLSIPYQSNQDYSRFIVCGRLSCHVMRSSFVPGYVKFDTKVNMHLQDVESVKVTNKLISIWYFYYYRPSLQKEKSGKSNNGRCCTSSYHGHDTLVPGYRKPTNNCCQEQMVPIHGSKKMRWCSYTSRSPNSLCISRSSSRLKHY